MRAFKNGDPNGNGLADEIPYEATFADVNTGLYNDFSAFGIPMNEYFVHLSADGKVLFMPEEDGFRACVEWLHSLCQEGLLDVESLTQGSNLWAAKVNQQKAGYFTYWRLKNTALSDDIAADYVVMLPVHAEGYKASLARTEDAIEFGAALTIQNHDIPSSLRWLDAQFETENMLVAQNGKIGDTLILRGDGRYEVTYVPAGNELYKTVPIICGQFFAPASYYASVYVPAAHRQEKSAYCALYDESGVLEEVPYTLLINTVPITSEESARIQQLYTSLKSAVNAYLVEFVTRGVTDERFADFLAELNSIGAQEYVSLYQTAYDRYMKGLSEQCSNSNAPREFTSLRSTISIDYFKKSSQTVNEKYDQMTRGVLFEATDPEKALAQFGIEARYSVLTDTYSTQSYPVVLPESGALDEGFLDRYTTADVTLYYLRHPIQLLGLFEVGVRNAFFTRTDYSGNYEQSSGMPARAKALFLSIWSTFKERSAPQTAASLLLLVVAFLFFRRKADEKLESGREAASVYTMLSVLLFAAVTVELMTVVILSGDSLLLRQSFLMGCLIDLLAIMAYTEGLHRLKIIETDGQ